MPGQPEVDVVIAIYRPGAWIAECLASVRAQRGVSLRTILVDDDPSQPLAEQLAATMPDAVAIRCVRNVGYAAANNAGIAVGTAPLVLCLNQDARMAEDFLARLMPHFRSLAALAAASGKILHQPSATGPPDGLLDSAGIAFRHGRRAIDIGQGEVDDGRFDGWTEVFGVSAAAGLYRRSALEAVSAGHSIFDESFTMYKEDVDLAWRLRRAGYSAGVDGSAVAYHGRSTGRPPARNGLVGSVAALWSQERAKANQVRRLSWRNQMLMLMKNESSSSLAGALPALVLVQLVQAGFDLLLDPIGGLVNRLRLVRQVPHALGRRAMRRRRRRPPADLGRWLR